MLTVDLIFVVGYHWIPVLNSWLWFGPLLTVVFQFRYDFPVTKTSLLIPFSPIFIVRLFSWLTTSHIPPFEIYSWTDPVRHFSTIDASDMISDGWSSLLEIKYLLISLLHSSTLKLMCSLQSLPRFWSFYAKSYISFSCRFSASLLTIIKDSCWNLSFVLLPLFSINCFICIVFLVIEPFLPARSLLRVLTLSLTCPCICSWSSEAYLLGRLNVSLDIKPYRGSSILLSLFMVVLFLNSR